MSFFRRLKRRFAAFMASRNGVDHLGVALVCASLALQMIALFTRLPVLFPLSYALYIWMLFRVLSKNKYKRAEENRKFVYWSENALLKTKQFFRRVKGMRHYKYFKCPRCKTLLRLNRGAGAKNICCPKCKYQFHIKA